MLARRQLAAALSAALVASVPAAAAADDPARDAVALERIEVVGSRIRRVDTETWQPLLLIEREQLERTGLSSVGDILQDLTAHGAALNTTVNNGGDGTTRVDLRNLGDNRTLVLVDGRRWIAGIDGAVDLNSIPLAMVERIEVLKDGASAIYGSDAIAGVVNVVTRRGFEGMDVLAQVGEAQAGDGRVERWEATLGAAGDRGSASLGLSRVEQDPIFAGARDISAVPTFGVPGNDTRAGASPATPAGLFGFGPRGNCPFEASGIYPSPASCASQPGFPPGNYRTTLDLGTGAYRLFRPATDGYNFAPENYLQTPQERTALFALARYELGEAAAFSADVLYNERRSARQLAPDSMRLSITFPGVSRVSVPADHVYNPFGQVVNSILLRPGGQVRRFEADADTFRATAGLDGSFMVGERIWSWDVSAGRAEYDIRETRTGLIDFGNLQRALGPSFRDAQGVARCGTPAAPIAGCVPFDAFHGPGAYTQAMLDYVFYVGKESTRTRSNQFAAHLSGELFDLPAGPLAMAAGWEHRRDQGESLLDALQVAANNLDDTSFSGRLSTDEQFVELSVPLLAGARHAQALDLSLAARRSDYDAFGATTNGEAGLQFRPVADVLLRASWSQGFRAPVVSELYFPVRVFIGDLQFDPCIAANATGAARRANCAADGVPGGAYDPAAGDFQVLTGGNLALQPEEAVSRGVGVAWSPSALPGFDASLDWYRIEVDDAIAEPDAVGLLRSCVDAGVPEACASTVRGPLGELRQVDARRLNSGLLAVEGWDLTLAWRGDTPLGRLELAWDSTYTSRYDAEIPRGAAARSAVGNNVAFEPGFRLRSNVDLAWRRGAWSAAVGVRYYSGLDEACIGPASAGYAQLCSAPGTPSRDDPAFPENHVPATTFVDVQAGWDAPWGSRLVAGVHNVLDRDPPLSYAAAFNSFDPSYPIPGRFWYLRLTHAF